MEVVSIGTCVCIRYLVLCLLCIIIVSGISSSMSVDCCDLLIVWSVLDEQTKTQSKKMKGNVTGGW